MIIQTHLAPAYNLCSRERLFCHPSRPRLPCTHPSGIWHGPARSRLLPAGRGPLLSSPRRPGHTRLPRAPPPGVPSTPRTRGAAATSSSRTSPSRPPGLGLRVRRRGHAAGTHSSERCSTSPARLKWSRLHRPSGFPFAACWPGTPTSTKLHRPLGLPLYGLRARDPETDAPATRPAVAHRSGSSVQLARHAWPGTRITPVHLDICNEHTGSDARGNVRATQA